MNAGNLTLSLAAGALALAACGGTPAERATTELIPVTTAAPTPTQPATTAPPAPQLSLTVEGFPSLEEGWHYEGWAILEGEPVTTGKFNVVEGHIVGLDGAEMMSFAVDADLAAATAIVITIEPPGDVDTVPADTHLVAGDVVDGSATLSISHPAALGTDFSGAAGRYVLATPSSDSTDDELSGVWFLTLPGPEASLSVPDLPAGWKYEGWAVIDDVPVSTGRFSDANAADEAAPYGGPGRMPPFPGEDFIRNPPDGLLFPTDLRGATIVVSVEPDPDDSPAPFALKPLVGQVPEDAVPEPTSYELGLNTSELPNGSATIG